MSDFLQLGRHANANAASTSNTKVQPVVFTFAIGSPTTTLKPPILLQSSLLMKPICGTLVHIASRRYLHLHVLQPNDTNPGHNHAVVLPAKRKHATSIPVGMPISAQHPTQLQPEPSIKP
jgi:hypothetical protein